MNYSRQERIALAELFFAVGPDQPTLCEGWNTRDLAVHLMLREHRLDAVPGMFVRLFKGHTDMVARRAENRPFEDIVRIWARGPRPWHPLAWLDRSVNLGENFVHHEDVRRGVPGWEPRELAPEETWELWRLLRKVSRPLLRKSKCSIVLEHPSGSRTRPVKRNGSLPTVTVRGEMGELLLWVFGRDAVEVDIDGDASGVVRGGL